MHGTVTRSDVLQVVDRTGRAVASLSVVRIPPHLRLVRLVGVVISKEHQTSSVYRRFVFAVSFATTRVESPRVSQCVGQGKSVCACADEFSPLRKRKIQ